MATATFDGTRSECGRYAAGGYMASVAREHLWRDVVGFTAYRAYMIIPTFLPFRWFMWMLPSVGDWSERDARWMFALEKARSASAEDA